jgi:dTDP-4-amino-4,6-dideoxygalactose transaminase
MRDHEEQAQFLRREGVFGKAALKRKAPGGVDTFSLAQHCNLGRHIGQLRSPQLSKLSHDSASQSRPIVERAAYRFRLVVPDLPQPESFLPYLQAAHDSGWFTNFGPLSHRLEDELERDFGRHGEICVSASSATAGLSAALLALGCKGTVLVPAFTFAASAGAVFSAGLEPFVMDVSEKTWTIDASELDRILCLPEIGAVMLVSPFGLPQDFSEHLAICERHGRAVVIDNAAGLGGVRPNRRAHPNVAEVFSMHATKPFGIGEGAMIFAHPRLEEPLRAALNFSLNAPCRPDLPPWGFNGKMSELHAGVGLAQAERFPSRIVGRRAFAARYIAELAEVRGIQIVADSQSAPWQVFPVLLPDGRARERAISYALEHGLEIRRYYHPSLSRWPQIRAAEPCPVSESLADRMCALPIRADFVTAEADQIVKIAVDAVKYPGRNRASH